MYKYGWFILLGLWCSSTYAASNWEPCFRPNISNVLECKQIPAGSGYVEVARKPALKLIEGLAPVFVLAGGPGQASGELAFLVNSALADVNQTRAIYFVDRRATGQSKPWQCQFDEQTSSLDDIAKDLKVCFDKAVWPVEELSSQSTIADIETIRDQEGLKKIVLWGGSWGTRTALLYATWHPNRIESMVLDGVVSLDYPLLLTGQFAQQALEGRLQQCQEQANCAKNFNDTLPSLEAILDHFKTPRELSIRSPATGELQSITLSWWNVAQAFRVALYNSQTAAMLPYIIQQIEREDYRPLASLLYSSGADSMYLGLTFSMMCSEVVPFTPAAELRKDSEGSFIGDSWYNFFATACTEWPTNPVTPTKPGPIDIPTLLISGSLDPVTPVAQAKRAQQHLTQSQHIIFNGGGHINSTRKCMPKVLADFYNQPKEIIDHDCETELSAPLFMVNAMGAYSASEEQQ